jgi:hypothetical protein
VVKQGKYITYKLSITGISNIKELLDSRLINRKKQALQEIIKRKDISWRIPNVDLLFEDVRNNLSHTNKNILYSNSVRTSLLRNGFSLSKKVFDRVVDKLSSMGVICALPSFLLLNKVSKNDLSFAQIISIKKIKPELVYNLEVACDCEPNYFANFIPVHNCMIDELDKMSKEDAWAMHEALEQQSISISKANIQATLRCETSVLAAANPKFGRFDPFDTVANQINLPSTLINRFSGIRYCFAA